MPQFQPAIGRVLVVDDEPSLLRGLGLILDKAGFDVALATSVATALGVVEAGGVDLVVTDLRMPQSSGLELLTAVRTRDAELPVILMTGVPDVDSAATAIEQGVWRYLTKPIDADKLVSSVAEGVARGRARRRPAPVGAQQLQRALDRLWLAYQPIVSWSQRRIFAFEALARSDEPGLQGGLLVEAAERHGSIVELGRRVRASAAATLSVSEGLFFVNLHPAELSDAALYDPASPLGAHARRVVFEVTERRSLTEIPNLGERLQTLRSMGYRFALDDLGAGYAGLASVAESGSGRHQARHVAGAGRERESDAAEARRLDGAARPRPRRARWWPRASRPARSVASSMRSAAICSRGISSRVRRARCPRWRSSGSGPSRG